MIEISYMCILSSGGKEKHVIRSAHTKSLLLSLYSGPHIAIDTECQEERYSYCL